MWCSYQLQVELARQYEEEAAFYKSSYKPADRDKPTNTELADFIIESSICEDVINDDSYVCDDRDSENTEKCNKRLKNKEISSKVESPKVAEPESQCSQSDTYPGMYFTLILNILYGIRHYVKNLWCNRPNQALLAIWHLPQIHF